jgi:hypothetical protein
MSLFSDVFSLPVHFEFFASSLTVYIFLSLSACLRKQEWQKSPEAVDMNGRFQMQGGKNWFLPKEMNANRFFWDSHWLEIWSNHFYPSMRPNGGSVAMDSAGARKTDGKT